MVARTMRAITVMVTIVTLAGCGSLRLPGDAPRLTHHGRVVHLTRAEPTSEKLNGVTLIRVDPDGAAIISVERTNERLRALPGEPFLGKRGGEYDVRVFGDSGLILRSSDVGSQAVVLVHRWASAR